MKGMIVVRAERCLGCKACLVACAVEHSVSKDLAGAVGESPAPQPRVSLAQCQGVAVPLQCRHCEEAPCVLVCPTKALHRPVEKGPVLVDAGRCIGCRYCLLACPFGSIQMSRDGKAVIKCDLCLERAKAGLEPACTAACPTGALVFCQEDQWLREQREGAARRLTDAGSAADKKP